jgi:endonuclease YncB( thermonuclease family)
LIAGGLTYPTTDGSNGQVLTTNGSGTLNFVSPSAFGSMTFVGDDSTGSTINTAETLKFTGSNNITTTVIDDTVTITGSKDINVNSITSGDSSAIQVADDMNVSGTLTAPTFVTNNISSSDSSAIQINDAINVSGNITLPKETNASVIADTFITRNAHIEAATTAVVNLTVTVGSKPADGKWFGQGSSACYYINGVAAPYIDIQQGKIYRFNQSAASNSTHPINIYYDEYKSRAFPDFTGTSYVTKVGTAGTSGAYTEVYVDIPARGRLSYQCQNHVFMGSFIVIKGAADPIQFVSDDSSGFYVGGNESVKFAGGNSIDTIATQDATDTITIALSNAITINEISSTDSTAIQINDGLNVSGQINMQGNLIKGVANPVAAQDVATKNYVDSGIAGFGPGTVTSITAGTGLTASPSNPITSTGTISLDFSTVVARIVGDDSTGTDLRVGETIKIAGTSNITTAVSGDTLTITGPSLNNLFTVVGDDSTGTSFNNGEILKIAGTSNITTAVSGDTLTITGPNLSSFITASSSDILTNKTIDANGTGNSISNIEVADFAAGVIDTDLTSVSASDDTLPSAKAVKAYIDSQNTAQSYNLTFVGDDSTGTTVTTGEIFKIAGTSNITTAVSGDTLTITGSKDIDINSISSTDSTAIQINDAVNISGLLTANAGLTINNNSNTWLFGSNGSLTFPDSTIQNTAARITVVGDDSTGVTLNAGETIKIAGTSNITTAVSGDTLTITGPNLSGYLTSVPKDIDVNSISSGDSTAIQINDSINISGTVTANSGLVANGITYPTTDGTTNQVLVTNGSGILSFTSLNSFAGITFVGDDSTGSTINTAETLKFTGSNNITTTVIDDTVTITGSKDINVNSISSGDSSAIQINDNVNVSGTFNAKTIVTNDLISEDSTAINVLDGMNVSGTLSADVLDVNEISSSDSSAIQINDSLNASGTITAASFVTHGASGNITGVNNIEVNQISSNDSTAVQVADGLNVSGTLTASTIVTNDISSGDSTAIQINDAVNVSGVITGGSNVIASQNLISNNSSGDEGGEILLAKPQTNSTIAGTGVTIDVWQNRLRFFEQGGSARGYYIDITNGGAGVSTLLSGGGSVPKDIDINSITSSDSSAIQINDAVNIAGTLSVGGNVISNVSDPVANQDAATKNYVDTQLSGGASTSFFVADDTSTVTTIDSGSTFKVIGAGSVTTALDGDTITITGAGGATTYTFIGDDSTGTTLAGGSTLQVLGGEGIGTAVMGNVITITNTSTQLEIDGGSAYSVYNAISEALIDGGTA